jgi:hypothetical protein
MPVRCAKGHWYDPGPSGTARCPQCATQTQKETRVSDDDVLAIMSEPDEAKAAAEPEELKLSSSAIMRRKKVCPECAHEASYSFVHCPRCGTPLQLVKTDLPGK